MSSPQIQTIVSDEVCLARSSVEPDLLRETNLSFRQWLASPASLNELAFEGTLRIDAYIAGTIHSDNGKLILNAGGTIDGDVFVCEALINGTVRGDIRGTQRIELGNTARVIGNIETALLVIRPGATFEGHCAFTSAATSAREAA